MNRNRDIIVIDSDYDSIPSDDDATQIVVGRGGYISPQATLVLQTNAMPNHDASMPLQNVQTSFNPEPSNAGAMTMNDLNMNVPPRPVIENFEGDHDASMPFQIVESSFNPESSNAGAMTMNDLNVNVPFRPAVNNMANNNLSSQFHFGGNHDAPMPFQNAQTSFNLELPNTGAMTMNDLNMNAPFKPEINNTENLSSQFNVGDNRGNVYRTNDIPIQHQATVASEYGWTPNGNMPTMEIPVFNNNPRNVSTITAPGWINQVDHVPSTLGNINVPEVGTNSYNVPQVSSAWNRYASTSNAESTAIGNGGRRIQSSMKARMPNEAVNVRICRGNNTGVAANRPNAPTCSRYANNVAASTATACGWANRRRNMRAKATTSKFYRDRTETLRANRFNRFVSVRGRHAAVPPVVNQPVEQQMGNRYPFNILAMVGNGNIENFPAAAFQRYNRLDIVTIFCLLLVKL